MTKIYKLYPSSSGFANSENSYVVDYNSACLRYILPAYEANRVEIKPIYGRIGAIHEDRHAAVLGERMAHRELPIKVNYSENIQYSGRADFITVEDEIHETKASLSKNFLYSVIRKKKVKLSHLAQLVSYLIHFNKSVGKIVTGFYKHNEEKDTIEFKEGADFDVKIEENGDIYVDNKKYIYTRQNQEQYLQMAINTIKTGEIPKQRPSNYMEFMGPCAFCPLKVLCKVYDKDKVTSEVFKQEAIALINK